MFGLDTWSITLIWGLTSFFSVLYVLFDLKIHNNELGSLMKVVWILTVLYSSVRGLSIYFFAGRKQIKTDSLARKAFRSVSHCYSGYGAGEIIGVIIVTVLLSIQNNWVISLVTFILAFAIGFAFTMGPLIQEGESFGQALKDTLYSETASITVMELVAISVDILFSRQATVTDPLFWNSLLISLTIGLIAAYPVNIFLIKKGIKEGMHNPKEMMAS